MTFERCCPEWRKDREASVPGRAEYPWKERSHAPVRVYHRISEMMRKRLARLSSALFSLRVFSGRSPARKKPERSIASERAHRHGGVDPLHVGLLDENLSRLEAELLDLGLGDVLAPSELFNLSVHACVCQPSTVWLTHPCPCMPTYLSRSLFMADSPLLCLSCWSSDCPGMGNGREKRPPQCRASSHHRQPRPLLAGHRQANSGSCLTWDSRQRGEAAPQQSIRERTE